MKRYIKPNMQVEEMEINSGICAGSPAITNDNGPKADTTKPILDGGDASEALSKGYITRFDVWEEKWPD